MSDREVQHQFSFASDSAGLSAGLRATWVGLAVNVLLVILKLWAGYTSRSQALIADGVHSVSDLFSDVVVMIGLRWGRKAEDADHPYGHARIETISSMIVGFLLLLVGLGVVYDALTSVYEHSATVPGVLAIYVAALSVILKEGLYWYTFAIGKKIRSQVLLANAWHHRSDALSSVAVLIGVGAAYFNPAWRMADAYAALVVTFFIGRVGIDLVRSAFRELSDTAPDESVLRQLNEVAASVSGVRQIHDLRARHSGAEVFVELHIVVDPQLTVREGHAIASEVKHRLLTQISDVTRVIIHVDPDLKES
ncbi:MAG: hypothetical protein DRP45_09505 [Candidatus Zixiibacteriota bacterium]|nr:MAG: hypothetical protein DRP45_09505 [candidate division Zixibacteria bacterium]